jgi:hypothetical protein
MIGRKIRSLQGGMLSGKHCQIRPADFRSGRRQSSILWAVTIFTAFCLAFPPAAEAYLDPGTASYAAQIVIGSILGACYAFRSYLARFLTGLLKALGMRRGDQ